MLAAFYTVRGKSECPMTVNRARGGASAQLCCGAGNLLRGDLLAQSFQRDRFATPGARDHRPKTLRTLEQQVLKAAIIYTPGVRYTPDGRHRPAVTGHNAGRYGSQ